MTDLGPLPEIHPRQVLVEHARRGLDDLEDDWRRSHGLTLCEELMLLSELLHRKLSQCVVTERRKK